MCVINKGGALEKRVIRVFIYGGARQRESDKETGATPKKGMSPDVPGGMGAEQFDRCIIHLCCLRNESLL